jgi:hypothetical protein
MTPTNITAKAWIGTGALINNIKSANATAIQNKTMGYCTETEHCAHGFRTTASTLINAERDRDGRRVWNQEAVEFHLAQVDNSVRAIYDRDPLWGERVRLMQYWADNLETLRPPPGVGRHDESSDPAPAQALHLDRAEEAARAIGEAPREGEAARLMDWSPASTRSEIRFVRDRDVVLE